VYNCDKQYSTEPSADPGAGGRGGHIHIKHLVTVNIYFTLVANKGHNDWRESSKNVCTKRGLVTRETQ